MELIHNLCLLLVWGYLSGRLSGIRQVFIKRIYLEDPMHKTITNISENIVLTGHFIKILLTLYLNLINNV